MNIQNILDRNPAVISTICATETLKSAADRMRAQRIAVLAVKGGEAITGLISEREIVHALAQHGERALSMAILEVASDATITVGPEDSLKRAMTLMTHHRLQYLPVIANSKLAGIVSIADVTRHRVEDLETESNVLRDAYIAAH